MTGLGIFQADIPDHGTGYRQLLIGILKALGHCVHSVSTPLRTPGVLGRIRSQRSAQNDLYSWEIHRQPVTRHPKVSGR